MRGGYLGRLYWWFRSDILAQPWRMIILGVFVVLLVIPLSGVSLYVVRVLSLALIFALYAVSWDVLAGFTGLLSLGHALFLGIGAYVAALLNLNLGLAPWATIPIGGIAATATGLIVAIPVLRLRGIYLTLVTLAFPFILAGLVYAFPEFTGGELGLFGVEPLTSSSFLSYYIILSILIGCALAMWKLTDRGSRIIRTGLIFKAICEDEITARISGINTVRYKFLAFSVSGFFAGIAGGLYVHFIGVAGPSTLELIMSFYPLLYVALGGMGTIYGGIIGVLILHPITEFIRLAPNGEEMRMIVFALILILVLMFMPQGITPWVRDKIERVCPRCKLTNSNTRRYCRGCGALLHLET